MQYQDLSYYRVGSSEEPLQDVFPAVRYVGWLDEKEDYNKGSVSKSSMQKLKEMLFLDLKYAEEKKDGTLDASKLVQVHQRYRRGQPQPCPFCKKTIAVQPINLSRYNGTTEKALGRNQLCLPSLSKGEFYASPTLIYHYITAHTYQPPEAYLRALEAFDLSKPFDASTEQSHINCIQVPTHEVDKLHLQPIPKNKYPLG